MLEDIRAASDTVLLEMYIFAFDATGRAFRDELRRAVERDVVVRVIYDSLGCLDVPKAFFVHMLEAGIDVHEFNPVSPLAKGRQWRAFPFHRRDHRKLLVVDNRVCYVGGINIADTYLDWEDLALRMEGVIARAAAESFHGVWENASSYPARLKIRGPRPAGNASLVDGIPGPRFSPITRTYLSGLKKARSEVFLVQAYFFPPRRFRKALDRLVRKGVDVKVVLPATTDIPSQWYGAQYRITHYLRHGVRVFLYEAGMLHAKYAIVDRSWATVGSANVDPASLFLTLELNLVLRDTEVVEEMRATFERVLSGSRELDLETWRRRPWWQKVLAFAFYYLRRLTFPIGG